MSECHRPVARRSLRCCPSRRPSTLMPVEDGSQKITQPPRPKRCAACYSRYFQNRRQETLHSQLRAIAPPRCDCKQYPETRSHPPSRRHTPYQRYNRGILRPNNRRMFAHEVFHAQVGSKRVVQNTVEHACRKANPHNLDIFHARLGYIIHSDNANGANFVRSDAPSAEGTY